MTNQKLTEDTQKILTGEVITKRELQNVLNRFNNGKVNISDINYEELPALTPEQQQQGFNWLWNQFKSPTGKVRKNNPFGAREIEALENYSHIELDDFHPGNSIYRAFYVPVYSVYSKDGFGFEYYVSGGQVHIVG